ncbi:GNAT family N-acetyltransferase [Methylosinus sp. Sm6]|uniref:GNAT family N-acetyltransferase n=1 Tax=Methylosinus sp. Sm6 TaxID=2866948 RepID=UPI001C9963A5|nr:GNAT family N-acetyltransferase [Methylosinus sp. Sm6]MBY6240127.1 GNAT family N-acetyltransferase [Methylosinus sp. Sm6]
MSELEIRPATSADADAIATLHVASWAESYASLAPAEVLADYTLETRLAQWRETLGAADAGRPAPSVFLALRADGVPVGFCACGGQQNDVLGERGYAGEFQAIYLLKEAQRRGLGRRLMRRMAEDLRARGIEWASLWVLRHNFSARRFYEKIGGRKIAVEGAWRGVPEVAYGWRDLGLLIDPPPARPW